ncbi:MAG: PorP/SprF family type IX secretion system membrane protein [Bacteroidetes bacterium]|nr:PorP/SprF family type IX secretion system membrane protein [Bacteroidota bacterium]
MKTKHIILFLLTLAFVPQLVKGQDVHFSQYAETPSIINPALAGVVYNTRAAVNYKSQWQSVATKYETMGFSFEQTIAREKLKGNYFAVAFNVFRDAAGDAKLRNLNPNLGITYFQKINKKMKVSGGLQSGLNYRTIDVSALRWDEQYNGYAYDPNLPSGESTPRSAITSFDMGGGVNLNYVQSDKFMSAKNAMKFDVGIAAYHYRLGRNSFITTTEKLNTRYCAYFSGDFNIPNSMNALAPSFLYMRQGTSNEFIAGALFKFILGDPSVYTQLKKPHALSIGGYYRFRDAVIPSILYQYDTYAIGISYDINVSALTPASKRRGGIEIMLRYNLYPTYGTHLGRKDVKASY